MQPRRGVSLVQLFTKGITFIMFRSVKLGSIRGIGVYVHWTFWMLVLLYAVAETARSGLAGGIEAGLFIAAVFACVLAHEFGHAAAAAYYGIKTTDITLMIVGGMARLVRLPDRPVHELVIAIAGPAVNVAIASVLFVVLAFGISLPDEAGLMRTGWLFTQNLLVANVVLVLFNMLPAFPMDGGRVLRSLLAIRQGQLRATEIAAKVGRWMAFLFAIAAIYTFELPLLLVAGFVYVAGTAELMQVRLRSLAQGSTQTQSDPLGNPFGSFEQRAQPFQPFEFRSGRDGDVIDAVEVREIRRD